MVCQGFSDNCCLWMVIIMISYNYKTSKVSKISKTTNFKILKNSKNSKTLGNTGFSEISVLWFLRFLRFLGFHTKLDNSIGRVLRLQQPHTFSQILKRSQPLQGILWTICVTLINHPNLFFYTFKSVEKLTKFSATLWKTLYLFIWIPVIITYTLMIWYE